jgi:hypothetical protein
LELFMATVKVKVDKALYDRVAAMAQRAGYSSPDEFIAHMLEREVATLEQAGSDEKVEERLRGLGYIE